MNGGLIMMAANLRKHESHKYKFEPQHSSTCLTYSIKHTTMFWRGTWQSKGTPKAMHYTGVLLANYLQSVGPIGGLLEWLFCEALKWSKAPDKT